MRTTLTLDDDLGALLAKRARELGISFREAVNRAIRTGLGAAAKPKARLVPRTIAHSFGFKPGIDLDKLNQLSDELEAEAFVDSWERKKRDSARRKRSRARS